MRTKAVFFGLHVAIASAAVWTLWWEIASISGWPAVNATRGWLITVLIALYVVRHWITLFVMLTRPVPLAEALGVSVWIAIIYAVMVIAAASNHSAVSWIEWVGVALYLVGSALNTGSEWQRRRFKMLPGSEGRLYTGGLFGYAQHINFLGDSLAFTGFALAAGVWWALSIPALMTAMFVWFHIPRLDAHLADHYGEQFAAYQAATKRFLPFVW